MATAVKRRVITPRQRRRRIIAARRRAAVRDSSTIRGTRPRTLAAPARPRMTAVATPKPITLSSPQRITMAAPMKVAKQPQDRKRPGDRKGPEKPRRARKRRDRDGPRKPHKGKGPGKNKGKKKGNKPKKYKFGKPGRKLVRQATNITERRFLYANKNLVKKQVAAFRKRRGNVFEQRKKEIKRARKRLGPKKEKQRVQAIKKKYRKKLTGRRKRFLGQFEKRGVGASPIYRKAGLAVSAELDPQLKALTSRIKQTKREKKRTLTDLRGLYERALEQHKGYKGEIQASTQKQIEDTAADFDRLVGNIGQEYGTSRSNVTNELERLGIGAATAASTEGLNKDEAYAKSLARTSGQEAGADLKIGKSDYSQLMSLLGGEINAQGLGARTEAQQKFIDALMAYRDQRSALAATRLGKISTAAEALKAARAAQKAEAAQNRLANMLARKEFGLDVAKFKYDVRASNRAFRQSERQRRIENRLDWAKYGLDKFEVLSELKGGGKRKLKRKREYSNSRGGAVDYLRDRGASNSVVDRYIKYAENPTIPTIVRRVGKVAMPTQERNNRIIGILARRLKSSGMNPKVARAFADALRIEWGLI